MNLRHYSQNIPVLLPLENIFDTIFSESWAVQKKIVSINNYYWVNFNVEMPLKYKMVLCI